ncbi:MAG: DUF4334 domain-containing protein [Cyanobacteria bacterium P01_A01_bin.83]
MNTREIQTILQQKNTTTEEALKLFDELDTVDLEFMIGKWRGSGFNTNHPLDGLLEIIGWYGKEFVNPDCVHPLLFADGESTFKVDPNPLITEMGLGVSIPKNPSLKPLYQGMSKLLKTEKSKARIRMMQYRDRLSATMIYDYLPINDIFRKLDDNTVFGLMDWKGMSQPFFFILKRT